MPGTLTIYAEYDIRVYINRTLCEWNIVRELQYDIIHSGGQLRPDKLVEVRDRLIKHLYANVWQWGKNPPVDHVMVSECRPNPNLKGKLNGWRPLSTTNIGALLSVTHSDVVRALHREWKKLDTKMSKC